MSLPCPFFLYQSFKLSISDTLLPEPFLNLLESVWLVRCFFILFSWQVPYVCLVLKSFVALSYSHFKAATLSSKCPYSSKAYCTLFYLEYCFHECLSNLHLAPSPFYCFSTHWDKEVCVERGIILKLSKVLQRNKVECHANKNRPTCSHSLILMIWKLWLLVSYPSHNISIEKGSWEGMQQFLFFLCFIYEWGLRKGWI